jgi:hypothetical protein
MKKEVKKLCVPCHKETFGKEKEFIHLFEDIVRTV